MNFNKFFTNKSSFFCWIMAFSVLSADSNNEEFVVGSIFAELGNNLFQVSTTLAIAWDYGAIPYFPELVDRLDNPYNPHNVPLNYEHILYHCDISKPPGDLLYEWEEPSFAYHPIPYKSNMRLRGYFQSEKYFGHYRDRLLNFFSPKEKDLVFIQEKYGMLLEHPVSVGIQIRYQYEDPNGKMYIQYGKDFLRQAMKFFPENALYIVSSNNIEFAKDNIPEEMKNVFFLEKEPHYIDLFVLSMCKHNVITNSTFGWWSAWLNKNPDQKVIVPKQWFHPNCPLPTKDLIPEAWTKIDAKWGPLNTPETYK